MKSKSNKEVLNKGPKDKSLEAYKIWVTEIAERLTTKKDTIELTEAEWMASWKEYWKEIAPKGLNKSESVVGNI